MTMLPLTPGLLASAMMREDHAVFAPWFEGEMFSEILGRPEDRIARAIERIVALYTGAAQGMKIEAGVLEEFEGRGFYATALEDRYRSALEKQPGMMEVAVAAIGRLETSAA